MNTIAPVDGARALVVGIANYADRGVGRLPTAVVRDAEDFAQTLLDKAFCGFPTGSVRLLVDAQATRAAILAGLDWLGQGAPGTRVFFFSGHGVREAGESYLAPSDADVAALAETCIAAGDLTERLKTPNATRMLVLLDACHAAAAAELKGDIRHVQLQAGLATGALESLAQGVGRALIASCRAGEESAVFPSERNSVFTGALLAGLRGASAVRNDGYVRVLDLFHYLSQEVPKLAQAQHPVLKVRDMQDNFAIALDRGGQAKTQTHPVRMPPKSDDWWDRFEAVLIDLYPSGPEQDSIWSRAGGQLSRLPRERSGLAAWHAAIRMARQGGGGASAEALLTVARADYPGNLALQALD